MVKVTLPEHIPALLNNVPDEDRPQGAEETKFWMLVAYELSQLLTYARGLTEAQIVFNDFRHSGTQYIWEFYVNDLSRPQKNEYNWHLQNSSQWVYAGALVLSNGLPSVHH